LVISSSSSSFQHQQLLFPPGQLQLLQELTSASSLLDAAWLEKVRRAIGLKSMLPPPTEMEVARIVIPLVFEVSFDRKDV